MIKHFITHTHSTPETLKERDFVWKFWVGFMDGDGSVQVNHWRKQCLQFRLVTKVTLCDKNVDMMHLFKKHLGGHVRLNARHNSVLWVCDNRTQIRHIVSTVFQKHPPLTTRLQAQVDFLNECWKRQSVSWYLAHRNDKYRRYYETKGPSPMETSLDRGVRPDYFPEWCSGFLEAEGCFSVRTTHNNHSFSLGQNRDAFLLHHLRDFLGIKSRVRNPRGDFWVLESYRRDVFVNLVTHFQQYPLLGAKSHQFGHLVQTLGISKG